MSAKVLKLHYRRALTLVLFWKTDVIVSHVWYDWRAGGRRQHVWDHRGGTGQSRMSRVVEKPAKWNWRFALGVMKKTTTICPPGRWVSGWESPWRCSTAAPAVPHRWCTSASTWCACSGTRSWSASPSAWGSWRAGTAWPPRGTCSARTPPPRTWSGRRWTPSSAASSARRRTCRRHLRATRRQSGRGESAESDAEQLFLICRGEIYVPNVGWEVQTR